MSRRNVFGAGAVLGVVTGLALAWAADDRAAAEPLRGYHASREVAAARSAAVAPAPEG